MGFDDEEYAMSTTRQDYTGDRGRGMTTGVRMVLEAAQTSGRRGGNVGAIVVEIVGQT